MKRIAWSVVPGALKAASWINSMQTYPFLTTISCQLCFSSISSISATYLSNPREDTCSAHIDMYPKPTLRQPKRMAGRG